QTCALPIWRLYSPGSLSSRKPGVTSPTLFFMRQYIAAFFLTLGLTVSAAINPAPEPEPFTAKEIAQGYREHSILARPKAAHRASVDAAEAREGVHVREKFSRFGDLRVIELDNT